MKVSKYMTTTSSSSTSSSSRNCEPVERLSSGPSNEFPPFLDADIELSIADRFQKQVVLYPERIAVKGQRHSFTYNELNRYANRIARAILDANGQGVQTVGVLLDKDGPMAAALLAVLKAGKFYVPLDPSQPASRASNRLEDAQATLILADGENYAAALELSQGVRQVLNVEDACRDFSSDNLDLSLPPDSLAYIAYTSGSTGEPKGILQTHRNVLHVVASLTNSLHISSEDRLSLIASFSTAQAPIDIFCALLNGAALYPFDVKKEGLSRLADWVEEEEITIYHSTASIFRSLLGALDGKRRCPKLRLMKVGGERLLKKDADSFQRYFSNDCILVSQFGCTEATTLCQMFVGKNTVIHRDVVPVGFALPDVEILLLDDSGQPVGSDSIGEIVIRSRYLTPGYWRKPELTRAKFAAVSGEQDVRLYHTGDLGCISPAGCLEHLGRKDLQVKVRGFRVEISAIEMALHNLADVKQAVVIARELRTGTTSIEAYVVPSGASAPSAASLRASLAQSTPDYMVPSRFFFLDSLPLTPSGKVDLQSLRPIEFIPEMVNDSYAPPKSELELQIVRIWESLLETRPIGIRHDFFDLGGDSLLAVCMMAEIEAASGIRLSVSDLLSGPTVEALASTLLRAQREEARSPIVPVNRQGSQPPFFFLHGQFLGGGLYCRELARLVGSDQPFYAVMPHGLDGKPVPCTIEDMASDRLRAVLEVHPEGTIRLGGYCNGALVAFEMAKQLQKLGRKVDLLVMVEIHAPNMPYKSNRRNWRFVRLLSSIFSLDRDVQVKCFLRLRNFQNYLRHVARTLADDTWASILLKLRKLVSRIGGFVNRVPKTAGTNAAGQRVDGLPCYSGAIDCYVPDSYKGRIVLLRTENIGTRKANFSAYNDPSAGWSEIAPQIQICWLSGTHDTIISEHLDEIADHLARCCGASGSFAESRPIRQRPSTSQQQASSLRSTRS